LKSQNFTKQTYYQKFTSTNLLAQTMFFNSIFDEPSMFYQPRPVFARRPTYIRRPRTVHRRPQNDIFGFSDFMGGLDRTTEIPIRMVDESEPRNLRAKFDTKNVEVQDSDVMNRQVQDSKIKDAETQNIEPQDSEAQDFKIHDSKPQDSNIQEFKPHDSEPQNSETQNSEPQNFKNQDSESQDSKPQNNIDETSSETSQNHKLILEIQKTSRDIIRQIENTDLDCLDTKQETKMFKYAAENLYKLLEKLDMIHTADSEEKSLRKSTVKNIQRKLDSIDRKLAILEK